MPHATIFNSGDIDGCVEAIKKAEGLEIKDKNIDTFVEKYSRERIMNKMAKHILSLL